MSIIRIAVIAVCGMIAALFVRENKSSVHVLVTMATVVVIAAFIIVRLSGVIGAVTEIARVVNDSGEYIVLLVKITGITYVTQFSSDVCRDNGYTALSGQLEVFGRLSIAGISIPVIGTLFEVMSKCLK